MDGADVTPERMMLSLSAYSPAANDLSQRPAIIPIVPDLVDLIRQHIISRCIPILGAYGHSCFECSCFIETPRRIIERVG